MQGEPVMSLPNAEVVVWSSGRGMGLIAMPFGRENVFRWSGSGMLYSGWNETIDITISTADGTEQDSIELQHEIVPVSYNDIRDFVADYSETDRQIVLDSDLHKTLPAYGTFVVDDLDRIWLKHTAVREASTATWSILNAESVVLAEVALPKSVDLWVVQSWPSLRHR